MPGANRHRPPTPDMLFTRMYRRQIESDKQLRAELERFTARSPDIVAVLVAHCLRLLREKETMLQVIEANRYMAAALPRRPSADTRIEDIPLLTEEAS